MTHIAIRIVILEVLSSVVRTEPSIFISTQETMRPFHEDGSYRRTTSSQKIIKDPGSRFSCVGRGAGYYADVYTNCKTFHRCQAGGVQHDFTCPPGTAFSQKYSVCDWKHNIECDEAEMTTGAYASHEEEPESWFAPSRPRSSQKPGKRVSVIYVRPPHRPKVSDHRHTDPVEKILSLPYPSLKMAPPPPVAEAVPEKIWPSHPGIRQEWKHPLDSNILGEDEFLTERPFHGLNTKGATSGLAKRRPNVVFGPPIPHREDDKGHIRLHTPYYEDALNPPDKLVLPPSLKPQKPTIQKPYQILSYYPDDKAGGPRIEDTKHTTSPMISFIRSPNPYLYKYWILTNGPSQYIVDQSVLNSLPDTNSKKYSVYPRLVPPDKSYQPPVPTAESSPGIGLSIHGIHPRLVPPHRNYQPPPGTTKTVHPELDEHNVHSWLVPPRRAKPSLSAAKRAVTYRTSDQNIPSSPPSGQDTAELHVGTAKEDETTEVPDSSTEPERKNTSRPVYMPFLDFQEAVLRSRLRMLNRQKERGSIKESSGNFYQEEPSSSPNDWSQKVRSTTPSLLSQPLTSQPQSFTKVNTRPGQDDRVRSGKGIEALLNINSPDPSTFQGNGSGSAEPDVYPFSLYGPRSQTRNHPPKQVLYAHVTGNPSSSASQNHPDENQQALVSIESHLRKDQKIATKSFKKQTLKTRASGKLTTLPTSWRGSKRTGPSKRKSVIYLSKNLTETVDASWTATETPKVPPAVDFHRQSVRRLKKQTGNHKHLPLSQVVNSDELNRNVENTKISIVSQVGNSSRGMRRKASPLIRADIQVPLAYYETDDSLTGLFDSYFSPSDSTELKLTKPSSVLLGRDDFMQIKNTEKDFNLETPDLAYANDEDYSEEAEASYKSLTNIIGVVPERESETELIDDPQSVFNSAPDHLSPINDSVTVTRQYLLKSRNGTALRLPNDTRIKPDNYTGKRIYDASKTKHRSSKEDFNLTEENHSLSIDMGRANEHFSAENDIEDKIALPVAPIGTKSRLEKRRELRKGVKKRIQQMLASKTALPKGAGVPYEETGNVTHYQQET